MATALAGVVTVALIGVLALALWALFGGDSNRQAGGTGDGDTGPGTGNGGAIHTTPTPKTSGNGKTNTVVTPSIVLPAKAAPDPAAKVVKLADGRDVYDWVIVRVGEKDVRFRLITPSGGPPVAPFYIMESKVWSDLYRGVAAVRPDSEKNEADAPVSFITVEEAANFALSAFGNNYRLPSPDEWDHAAGLYVVRDRPTVTRRGGQPRVRIARPGPTHGPMSRADVNEFDLLDMAGNGREFTRAIQAKSGEAPREVTGGNTTPLEARDSVILRGRNFTLSTELTFQDLRDEQTKLTQRQFATARSPYTSFRVVVPVP
jgi:hypothetical protein